MEKPRDGPVKGGSCLGRFKLKEKSEEGMGGGWE